MAKEAIALVIDVSLNASYEQPAFENALHCASKLLVRKLLSESRDLFCLVLAGTTETSNQQALDGDSDPAAFQHIMLADQFASVSWALADRVRTLSSVSSTKVSADLFAAIRVAFDHLQISCTGRRDIGARSVVVFSHTQHKINRYSLADVEQLTNDLNESQCGVNWIHPEENASVTVSTFVNGLTNGIALTQENVIGLVKRFHTRQPRATAWKVQLEIGSSSNRKSVYIPVCGYLKIREAKQKTMQSVLASNPDVLVKSDRTFFKPEAAGASDPVKREDNEADADAENTREREHGTVSADEIEHAYRFGRDLVVVGDAEYQNMRYRSAAKCLQLIKIVPRFKVPLSQLSGDGGSMILVGDPASSEAQSAISALVCALDEADACAIVRKCYSAASLPRLFVLLPRRSRKMDKLICVGLPFAEDFRGYHFESLPIDETVLAEKPYLRKLAPTEAQSRLVDELVAASVAFAQQREENMSLNAVQNPYLQRFLEACEAKAGGQQSAYSGQQPRAEADALLDGGSSNLAWRQMLETAAGFNTQHADLMKRVHDAFELKKVAKADGRQKLTGYSMFLGRADADINVSLTQEQLASTAGNDEEQMDVQVGSVSAVRDFIKLAHAERDEMIVKGFAAMRARIEEFLDDEFAQPYFPKIVECLNVLRLESIKSDPAFEQCRLFNEFLLRLKQRVTVSSNLREFWQLARDAKLALITKSDVPNFTPTGYSLADAEESESLYDVLDKPMDLDVIAAAKQQQIQEDDFDPFAEVQWNV